MRIISDHGYRASTWAFRVVLLVSTAGSRTERLVRLLLTGVGGLSKNRPQIVAAHKRAPKKKGKKIVAVTFDRRNTV